MHRASQDPLALRDQIIPEAARLFKAGKPEAALQLLRRLKFATIDETTLKLTDPLLGRWIVGSREIVATTDPSRVPASNEVVIIYGNYPHFFENLVVNNPIKRHVADFWNFGHDRVEYATSWAALDRIYIVNSAKRMDRWDAVLRELARARAPFDRITRVEAIVDSDDANRDTQLRGHIGCLKSHLAVLCDAKARQYHNILVLEDDFCFTTDLNRHLEDLQLFFDRRYEFWVCLLATSKYGLIVEKDDLLSYCNQECTNTAAYLLSQEGLNELLPVQEAALAALVATGDTMRYSADRYWSVLQQSGKFLVFNRKFGFQGASFSDIERAIARYLD